MWRYDILTSEDIYDFTDIKFVPYRNTITFLRMRKSLILEQGGKNFKMRELT